MGRVKEIYFEMLEKLGEDVIIEDSERALEQYTKEQAIIKAEEQSFQEAVDRLYNERD